MKQVIGFTLTDEITTELHIDVVLDRVELRVDLIYLCTATGRSRRWGVGTSTSEIEYAADAAEDLEAAMWRSLEDEGVHGWRDDVRGFGGVVEAELQRLRDEVPAAAE